GGGRGLAGAPFVAIDEGIGEGREVGAVQHHRLVAVEVEDRLALLLRALSDHLHLDMADRRDDRPCLDGGGLDVARRKRVPSFQSNVSILELMLMMMIKFGFRFGVLCRAPPPRMCGPCARRSAWSAPQIAWLL